MDQMRDTIGAGSASSAAAETAAEEPHITGVPEGNRSPQPKPVGTEPFALVPSFDDPAIVTDSFLSAAATSPASREWTSRPISYYGMLMIRTQFDLMLRRAEALSDITAQGVLFDLYQARQGGRALDYEALGARSQGVDLARLAAAGLCDLGVQGPRINEAGELLVRGIMSAPAEAIGLAGTLDNDRSR